MVEKIKNIVTHSVFLQIISWISLYLLVTQVLLKNSDQELIIVSYIEYIIVSYINLLILIPLFFKRQRYLLYGIYTLTEAILGALLCYGLYYIIFYPLLGPESESSVDDLGFIIFQILMNLFFIGFTSYIKFISDSSRLNILEKKYFQIEQEKLQAELDALKSQINPHFLFNSLNNIYSLSLVNSPTTPQIVLKLSEILRYMLYECNEKYVLLEKELKYVKNYIELQKIRTRNDNNIKLNIHGNTKSYKIPPLLLTTPLENAFKHGISNEPDETDISIEINIENKKLTAIITNNIVKNDHPENKEYSGIGLKNLVRRLELLEQENYSIKQDIIDNKFVAKLNLALF